MNIFKNYIPYIYDGTLTLTILVLAKKWRVKTDKRRYTNESIRLCVPSFGLLRDRNNYCKAWLLGHCS